MYSKYLAVIGVFALLMAAFAVMTTAAPDHTTIDMADGERFVILCDGAFIEHDYSVDPGLFDVECDGIDVAPTATTIPATVEPTATSTEVPPTATANDDPTVAPTEPPTAIDNAWHPPGAHDGLGVHEHGDAPPAIFEQWSIDTFGHGIIYGGDEGTPNENEYKHQGFGGFVLEDDGVLVYLRTHMMTTPLGRSGPCHSVEVYAAKNGEVVGFWQHWISYTADRSCDPAQQNLVIQCADSGLRPIVKAAPQGCPGGTPFENWYANTIGIGWDIGQNSQQTTYANGDPGDPSTWILTGDNEPTRRIEAAFYRDRTANVFDQVFALTGGAVDIDFGDWFCITPQYDNIAESATPGAPGGCPAGFLDNWISPAMTTVDFDGTNPDNSVQKTFTCPACEFPNH